MAEGTSNPEAQPSCKSSFRCPSKPTTGRFKVSTSDSREPNAFQDLRSEKLLFSYFLIPTQILRKSKQVNFSRIQKFLNFAVSSNMLLILLMPKPLLSITRFMFKNLSFCGFFLVI